MKRLIAILLAAAMLLAFAACAEKEPSESTEPSESSSQPVENRDPIATVPPDVEPPTAPSEEAPSEPTGQTVGNVLLQDFRDRTATDPSLSAQELADALMTNEAVVFAPATMPVEEGLLMGFDNFEVTGFAEGCQFGPMMGSIPFLGYIFVLKDETDGDAFVQALKDNANLNWNICISADELFVERSGSTVFFLMSPLS